MSDKYRLSRDTRGLFGLGLDFSGSTNAPSGMILPGTTRQATIAEIIAFGANDVIEEVYDRVGADEEDLVKDYCDFGAIAIGLGPNPNQSIWAWSGPLEGRQLVSITDLAKPENFLDILQFQKNQDSPPIPKPIWIRTPNPMEMGGTPLADCMEKFIEVGQDWALENQRGSLVFTLLTDGEATRHVNGGIEWEDPGRLIELATQLKGICTEQGPATLLCFHVKGGRDSAATPTEKHGGKVIFAANREEMGGNPQAELLYDMASQLPEEMLPEACRLSKRSSVMPLRGVCRNASPGMISQLLKFGTVANVARDLTTE